MVATAAWQIVIVNAFAGILWTGYNLASFNLLLEMAPEPARAEATALFQLVVLGSAVIVKVKEPIEQEWKRIRRGQVMFHLLSFCRERKTDQGTHDVRCGMHRV